MIFTQTPDEKIYLPCGGAEAEKEIHTDDDSESFVKHLPERKRTIAIGAGHRKEVTTYTWGLRFDLMWEYWRRFLIKGSSMYTTLDPDPTAQSPEKTSIKREKYKYLSTTNNCAGVVFRVLSWGFGTVFKPKSFISYITPNDVLDWAKEVRLEIDAANQRQWELNRIQSLPNEIRLLYAAQNKYLKIMGGRPGQHFNDLIPYQAWEKVSSVSGAMRGSLIKSIGTSIKEYHQCKPRFEARRALNLLTLQKQVCQYLTKKRSGQPTPGAVLLVAKQLESQAETLCMEKGTTTDFMKREVKTPGVEWFNPALGAPPSIPEIPTIFFDED